MESTGLASGVRDPAGDRPARRARRPPRSRATSSARRRSRTTRSRSRTRFADAGARWLHVVDLDGARAGRAGPRRGGPAIVAAVGERVAVEVAGGLRTRRPWPTSLDGRRRVASSSGRRPCATRRSPVGSSRRTAPRRSRSRSTSATAGPSARAGPTDAAGVDAGRGRPTARRRRRHDVRGHRHRARRPSGGPGPRALRAAGGARPRRDHRVGGDRDRSNTCGRSATSAAPARSSGARSTTAASTSPSGDSPRPDRAARLTCDARRSVARLPWPPAASSSLRCSAMTLSAMCAGTSS